MELDLSAIQTLGTSLKTVLDIVKGIREAKSTTETESKVGELQAALLETQILALSATNAQVELQKDVRELEEQLKAANDWGAQENRYTLVCPWREVSAGQVYALKKSASEGEPSHFVCTNCFHRRKKVILNPVITDSNNHVLVVCPSCKATVETGYRGRNLPLTQYAEEYETRGEG